MTFYEHLTRMGYAADDFINEKIVILAKSPSGALAVGLFTDILACENEEEEYFISNHGKLTFEILTSTPEEFLSILRTLKNQEEGEI